MVTRNIFVTHFIGNNYINKFNIQQNFYILLFYLYNIIIHAQISYFNYGLKKHEQCKKNGIQ